MGERLTKKQRDVMNLLGRTPPDKDGWSRVSPACWPLMAEVPAELVECELTEDGWGRARFTEAGQTIMDWT